MEGLNIDHLPEMKNPCLVGGFLGWPDAGDVASSSIAYIAKILGGKKFASFESEVFYDFTKVRPQSKRVSQSDREILWPTNDFYHCRVGDADLLLFLGTEPHLKWKRYIELFLGLAERCGVANVVILGATYDNVLHTGEPLISGATIVAEMRDKLDKLGVSFSDYQGPTSIHSVILQMCNERNIPGASLWGHSPAYVQVSPNTKTSYGLLKTVSGLIGIGMPLESLKQEGRALEHQVDTVVDQDPRLQAYIDQINDESETRTLSPSENLDPDQVIEELEEFLKNQGSDVE